jgi:hypothetical protein
MSTEQSIRNLSALRLAVGLISWLAPNLGGRLFGLDPAGNPQAPYFARLFGIRDVALAVGATQSSGEAQKQWLQLGIACDAADVAAAALGRRGGYLPLATTIMVGGTALVAAGIGVQAIKGAPTPAP